MIFNMKDAFKALDEITEEDVVYDRDQLTDDYQKQVKKQQLQEAKKKNDIKKIVEKKQSKSTTTKTTLTESNKKKVVKESKLVEEPIYDLKPRHDSRQSFYGKAIVDTGDKGDKNKLYSYGTLVAEIKDGKPVVYGTYSATTLRHIKEWLQQLGFKAISKAQIEKDYMQESCKESCQDESCKVNECGDNKIKLNEKVSDIAYEIEEEVCDMLNGSGKNIIESDEVDTYIQDAVKKLYNVELYNVDLYNDTNEDTNIIEINGETFDINDLVNDIRGILGMDGWETIFEGEHEGGVTDDIDSLEDDVKKYCVLCGNEKEDYEASLCDACFEKEWDIRGHKSTNEDLKKTDNKKPLKEATQIDISDEEEVEKGKEILKDNEKQDAGQETMQVVDVNAETVDKLKDSYMGNVILQCPVCRTAVFRKPDLLKKDEENVAEDPKEQIYNVGEQCPHCGSEDGYYLVGQVASMDVDPVDDSEDLTGKQEPDDFEDTQDEENKPIENDTPKETETDEEEEEITFESLDINRFNKVAQNYVNNIYENVETFETTNASIDDENNQLIIEGVIKFKDNKSKETKFVFEGKNYKGNKYIFEGLNTTFTPKKNAFRLKGIIKNKTLYAEALSYSYVAKVLNESKLVKGRVLSK